MDYASFDINKHPDLHPIFISCKNGELAQVENHLANGVSPYIEHSAHPSLAVIAIGEGNTAMINVMVAHGLDVNKPINRFGETPLLRAISKHDAQMVETLLVSGADPNLADQIGFSPLMAASSGGDINLIKLLISRGADQNQISDRGRNPLLEAVANDQVVAINWWLANGANLEQKDANDSTALIIAAKAGKLGSTQTLLEHGADIHAKDKRGKTALDWAKANGHQKIAELLRSRTGA